MATQNVEAALAAYNSMISGMSAQDLQDLNAMMQAAGYFASQTGFEPGLGTVPAAGTPTTTEQGITGYYIDPMTGELKPTLAAQTAYGGTATDPTLARAEAAGYFTNPDGSQTPTLAAQQQQADQAQKTLALIASLKGPANAFTQQAVLHGLNATGLSRAVDAIQGKYGLPTFSAPNANPQAASVQTLMDQVGAQQGAFVTTPNGQQTPEAATQDISWKPGDKIYTDPNGYAFVQVPTPTGANWVATGQKSVFAPGTFNTAATGGSSTAGTFTGAQANSPFVAPSPSSLSSGASGGATSNGAAGSWTGAGATYAAAPAPQASSGAINAGPTTDAGVGAGNTVLNPADGGTTVFGGTHIHVNGGTNAAGGASTLDPTTAAYVNALPAPNKINGPNWMNLDSNTQQFLLGAYQAAGYDPNDILSQVNAGLPQFKAPAAGGVASGGSITG